MLRRLDQCLLEQRGHLFPWVPVCLALGIGAYFALRFEPGSEHFFSLGAGAVLCAAMLRYVPGGLRAIICGLILCAIGFLAAGLRTHALNAPVLDWRYYGPIEGQIVAMDRSSSDSVRLTLDRVRLTRMAPGERPVRVRISLHGAQEDGRLLPGDRVMTTGHLMPPQGPAEPGGFDFRRHAWFLQLGAVGYTRNPVVLSARGTGADRWLDRFRSRLSRGIQSLIPDEAGGFAAAVTTGDRSGVSAQSLQALRDSNLAHLLAISGLHMGLLAGFVFASVRYGVCLFPRLALRVPVKRMAALVALMVAAVYLSLSGGNVATERAFVMVAVALCAVMLDRRALSLRAVALAACLVLLRRPETLFSPGFQMSFAATTALIAVFALIRDVERQRLPGWVKPVFAVIVSSAVAGLATAPFGAAHFNTMSHYGLIANLLSVPLMGVLVIPAAVVAGLLWPLGLHVVPLTVMGWGLEWILFVAGYVAGLDGVVGQVKAPGPMVLPLLSMGALTLILWQGRVRAIGVVPICAAFWIWSVTERPEILIDAKGRLVGVLTGEGRAVSKPKGAGFVAGIWLENDGDAGDQGIAAQRWKQRDKWLASASVNQGTLYHLLGKRAAQKIEIACGQGDIIIAPVPYHATGCRVLDASKLRETGSVAWIGGRMVTTAQITGVRPWTRSGLRREADQ